MMLDCSFTDVLWNIFSIIAIACCTVALGSIVGFARVPPPSGIIVEACTCPSSKQVIMVARKRIVQTIRQACVCNCVP